MRLRLAVPLLAAALVAGVVAHVAGAAPTSRAGDDAVVIAVIDSGFSPYHLDFRASEMPQARTRSKNDDLPLDKAPHTWLAGFPEPGAFEGYEPLRLTLPKDRKADMTALQKRDADAWAGIDRSRGSAISYRWVPGTKVIGTASFSVDTPRVYGTGSAEHGMGTASASTGNLYGSCPECLLVFLQAGTDTEYEAALSWAMKQSWIDGVSNSYGMSTSLVLRDRVYNGSDTQLMRSATERGQTVFFSAGNGVINDFVTPNGTLLSSQEGPDWIVTVGATDPANVDYPGSGKPADVASIGTQYPTGYGAAKTDGSGLFGGTSNATPVIAGTYGRALWKAREALSGPSRVQRSGMVATGGAVRCGSARRDCELGDGRLTRLELQNRLFLGATPSNGGFAGRRTVHRSVNGLETLVGLEEIPPPIGGHPLPFVTTPPVADTRFASEGYGTYRARLDGTAKWLNEFDTRVWDVMRGTRRAPTRPAEEVAWFRVDSMCRQHIWGSWREGAFKNTASTPLPLPDPARWPTRTVIQLACPALTAPPAV